jgi:hypothetical protein
MVLEAAAAVPLLALAGNPVIGYAPGSQYYFFSFFLFENSVYGPRMKYHFFSYMSLHIQ